MKTKKAAGYIRVSTTLQAEKGESLEIQTEKIKELAKFRNYKFTRIYADEGISGSTVKDRPGLQLCFEDVQNGKFDVLIVYSLSRFGRNARELLDNHNFLKELGIELLIVKENVDSSTTSGKLMLGLLSVLAEWEKDIIAERMIGGKIHKGRKGIPSSGSLPIGRKFNKETMQWSLDETVARDLQWAAREYLKRGSLRDIADEMTLKYNHPITYDNLRKTLKDRCGDNWTENLQGELFTYKIPRILDDETIKQIHDRISFNVINNRTDIKKKYLLSGFIFCEKCKRALVGQSQSRNRNYIYYRHSNRIDDKKCVPRPFNEINATKIEQAVFHTIFENIADVPSFEAAIAKSLPDKKNKAKLEAEINSDKKGLRRVNKELNKLVDLALKGTLTRETIKEKEKGLINQRDRLTETLDDNERRFKNMPDVDSVKKEADQIRRLLLEKYSGSQHFDNMTFEEKRELLHWLFDGSDPKGDRYGIYINKKGKRKNVTIDYFLYGRITGLRTLKGNDIDFDPGGSESDTNTIYNTKRVGYGRL